jgi:hypothetical protein
LPYNRPPSQPKALACTNIKLVFCSFAPLWHPLSLCTFGSDLGSSLSLSLSSLSPFAGCFVYIKFIRVSSVFPKFWKGHLYTTYYGDHKVAIVYKFSPNLNLRKGFLYGKNYPNSPDFESLFLPFTKFSW